MERERVFVIVANVGCADGWTARNARNSGARVDGRETVVVVGQNRIVVRWKGRVRFNLLLVPLHEVHLRAFLDCLDVVVLLGDGCRIG